MSLLSLYRFSARRICYVASSTVSINSLSELIRLMVFDGEAITVPYTFTASAGEVESFSIVALNHVCDCGLEKHLIKH